MLVILIPGLSYISNDPPDCDWFCHSSSIYLNCFSLLFFWLPASWLKPNLTLFSIRFKHHKADENPSSPPNLAASHSYSTDCGRVPHSLLSQELPLLLPVQALWWISQATKTFSRLPCWALQPASSYICLLNYTASPLSLPGPIHQGSGWPDPDPLIPVQRRASHRTHHAKVTVKHSKKSHQGTSSLIMCWALLGICAAAQSSLEEWSLEPALAPHGSGKNMLLTLKCSWVFIN